MEYRVWGDKFFGKLLAAGVDELNKTAHYDFVFCCHVESLLLSLCAYVAGEALDMATQLGDAIHVPSICLVELTYLIEKGRVPAAARQRLINAINDPSTPCRQAPLDRGSQTHLSNVSRSAVPDLPGRIVSATAAALGRAVWSVETARSAPRRSKRSGNDYCSHCSPERKSRSKVAQLNANDGCRFISARR
jgi:hypothetical protein